MMILDVSYAQGTNIDWKKAKKSGVQGAILRIGYGRETNQKDSTFEENAKGCKAAGVPILPYHYSYATDTNGAKQEASCFLRWAEGKTFAQKLVWFDIEEPSQYQKTPAQIRSIIDAYAGKLKKAGWKVGVYSYLYFLQKIGIDWLNKNYPVWVAQYAKQCDYTGKKVLWQYTSQGKVSGITGNVDVNECYEELLFSEEKKDEEVTGVEKLKNPYPKSSKVETVSYKKYGNINVTDNFKLSEFQCSDGSDTIKFDWYIVNALEAARQFFAQKISLSSAYRTEAYNTKIGGATGSYHTKGRAVDCYISGQSPSLLAKYFEAYGMKGVGCYYDDRFCHVDSRTSTFYWENQSTKTVSTHLPTIRSGSNGQDVKDLQRLLNLSGTKISEDGIFGIGTDKEVRNFQRTAGLAVDGIVGKNTWKALLKNKT